MYNEKVMERFKNPHNSGEIVDADAVGEVGNVKCGDMMRVYVKFKSEKNKSKLSLEKPDTNKLVIEDIKFKTYGCVAAIVSTDFLCDLVKGKTVEDALKITGKDIAKEMGDVPSIKFHCSILAHDALRKAVEEYNAKMTTVAYKHKVVKK